MNGRKIKSLFLLSYMGFAVWRVFYNIYLEDHGFTGTEIGIISGLLQATVILIVPVWGVVADKQGIRPTLWWVTLVSSVLIIFLGSVLNFWWLLFYIIILSVFHHPIGPLIDALAIQFSEKDKKYNYGKFRLWGSLGWALASIIGGYVFIHVDMKHVFHVSAAFFMIVLLILRNPWKRKHIYRPNFQPIELKMLFKNRSLFMFILILFFYGVACAPVNSFLNLYFRDLGANNEVIGIAYAIQAFSELPFFIIGERLVRTMGAKRVILISLVVMCVRMLIYGLFTDITIGLAACFLQGITLSFFLVGAVDYFHKLLPAGRHATAQSLIWGLYFGLGHTVGNIILGIVKDMSDMVRVMQIFTIIVMGVMLSVTFYFYHSRKKHLT